MQRQLLTLETARLAHTILIPWLHQLLHAQRVLLESTVAWAHQVLLAVLLAHIYLRRVVLRLEIVFPVHWGHLILLQQQELAIVMLAPPTTTARRRLINSRAPQTRFLYLVAVHS